MPPPQPTVEAATAPAPGQHTALYRRFRAQRFSELIGQDPIVATLRNAVTGDRLAHAYLFVGPRGTGKTSTARILAKAINCTNLGADGEPCDACPACVSIREGRALDVIEIDAASHGAVEDARDLVMRALTSPSELRKRVYIIDEVHMLSSHAFNALLKLIEEPPDHVVFILATTDTHKVPATIISRTQRHDFRRLPEATIVGKLRRIVETEGVEADDDALALIARLADGGMRDAESLLDQVISYADARITEADVREAVGLADDAAIGMLVDAYLAADAPAALDAVASLADAGRDLAQVAAQAEAETRRRLLASAADPVAARRLAPILRTLAEAAGAGAREGRSRLMLELLAVESLPAAPVAVPASTARGRARSPDSGCPARRRRGAGTATRASPHRPRRRPSPPPRPQPPTEAAAAPASATPSAGLDEIRIRVGDRRRPRQPGHQAAPQGVPADRAGRRAADPRLPRGPRLHAVADLATGRTDRGAPHRHVRRSVRDRVRGQQPGARATDRRAGGRRGLRRSRSPRPARGCPEDHRRRAGRRARSALIGDASTTEDEETA